jgi:hypothetical protein
VRAGTEWLSFEEAVRRENERVKQDIWKGYLKRSIYVEQVENYLDFYDLDSMYFCLFDKLMTNKSQLLRRLFQFLGLEDKHADTIDSKRKNSTKIPRSILLRYFTRKIFGDTSVVSKIEKKLNRRKSEGYPGLSDEVRCDLQRRFEPYNRKLRDKIGLDIGHWH